MSDIWSGEKGAAVLESLKTMWKSGLSGGKVAEALSKEFEAFFSRNAVIGKAHRLGLQRDSAKRVRSTSARQSVETRRAKSRFNPPVRLGPVAPPAEPIIEELPASIVDGGVNYTDNTDGCKALIGKRGSDGFEMCCGGRRSTTADGKESAYCPAHHRLFHRR